MPVPTPLEQLARLRAVPSAAAPALPSFDDQPDVPEKARERVLERVEAALAEGYLVMSPDQQQRLLDVLLPEDFVVTAPSPGASLCAAGTIGRLATYARRAARREPLANPADADPAREDRLPGVRIRPRKNGGHGRKANGSADPDPGVKALGFAEPAPEPMAFGMYRLPGGEWIEVGRPGNEA